MFYLQNTIRNAFEYSTYKQICLDIMAIICIFVGIPMLLLFFGVAFNID